MRFDRSRRRWHGLGRLTASLAVVAFFACGPVENARGSSRRGRFIRPPKAAEQEPAGTQAPLLLGPSNQPADGVPPVKATLRPSPAWERYPKFQGGFHSRQLYDLGVPTGDRGLRGNGFSAYPW
ncbi:MAG: hypothetical protein ACKO38_01505 [Planctomycetota bacterium]